MRKGFITLAAAGALVPATAFGAGLYVPDTGTEARARGGAMVANDDSPLDIFFNPGGDALQPKKNQFLFDITAMQLSETFTRNPTDIPADGNPADNKATNKPPPQIVPDILYLHRSDLGGGSSWSIGGGLHAPAGARYQYATHGTERFTASELYLVEAGLGVSGGYNFGGKVSVGATLETLITSVDQKFFVAANGGTGASEADANTATAHLHVMETLNPTGILGVMATPTDSLEFGASFRPSVHLDMPGTLEASVGPKENVHFKSDLPSILRLGGRYKAAGWDAELDLVREDWSVHKKDSVTADDGILGASGQKTQFVPRDWKAAYSVRAGSTFKLTQSMRGLGGVYYETSAVPTKTMDVGSYDGNKIGLNAGVLYDVSSKLTLGGNLSYATVSSQTVSDSIQQQSAAIAGSSVTTIGNGKYAGAYEFLGVSALYSW